MIIGTAPLSLSLWQTLTTMAILFHHSNCRLPYRVERRLCRIIVTPRMHGIHHSTILEEMDANWATIFSFPDFLHRTIRLNVPQENVLIGLPVLRKERDLTLAKLIVMPFTAAARARHPAEAIERRKAPPLPRTVLADGTELPAADWPRPRPD
jgi:sterol desaturase/sphingolipid hydroxylase (fatty acid hydroxylase superfamily)